jgi:tetratricopeptide (TPR) repeat protein
MRLTYLFVLLLWFLPVCVFAQQRRYSTTDKDAIKNYVLAGESIDEHLYEDAIAQLEKAINDDGKFVEAHALLADVLRLRRQNKAAIEHYLKVITLEPEHNRAIYLRVGEAEITDGQYVPAKQHLEKYITYPNLTAANEAFARKLLRDCEFSIEALQHPVPFIPINMGPEINTEFDEYLPVATADEATLIFTRKINNNEDFYKSDKLAGKWKKSVYLSDAINTPTFNEGAQSISQDGKYLFFTGCNRPDGQGRCDIYIAQKKGEGWGKPFSLSSLR